VGSPGKEKERAVVMERGGPGQGPLLPRLVLVVEAMLKFLACIDGTKKKLKQQRAKRKAMAVGKRHCLVGGHASCYFAYNL
jgi:hypothetical protein